MIEVTAKDLWRLRLRGLPETFSKHSQEREGIERAAKILAADPSLVVELSPPPIEIRASKQVALVEPPEQPVTSDGGEDLFDFLERVAPEPRIEVEITAPTLMAGLETFLDSTRTSWLIQKMYHRAADGTKTLVAYGWRGFGLVVHRRVKGTIKLGGTT